MWHYGQLYKVDVTQVIGQKYGSVSDGVRFKAQLGFSNTHVPRLGHKCTSRY